jgi:Putative ATPase subunit of terminase (gpP-like)
VVAEVSDEPNEVLKKQAEDMFFARTSIADISRALGISARTLSNWSKKGDWAVRREEAERGIIEDSFGARRVTIAALTRMSADTLLRAVKHLHERVEPATMQEAEKLAAILGNLDKISRLDANKATENLAIQGSVKLSLEEIRDVIASDPFFAGGSDK